jgi:hypothetical protein
VFVDVGAGVGVRVGVFVAGAVVFVGVRVVVFVGVRVAVFVGVGVAVRVAVGVFVGVAVGSGPIQIVTVIADCWKLFPVASSRIECEPGVSVDEFRWNDGPVPRNPLTDDVQSS